VPSQTPDDSLNLEDSSTLELGRLIAGRQPADDRPNAPPPELPCKRRQGDSKSRELLTNPFTVPEGGAPQ
jgi:hypothetical protein